MSHSSGLPIVIHGHFYQPPRENPWTDTLDREPSAHPCHDWNERIHQECYRPNAFARVLDAYDRVEGIVNNYAKISFNFGPTLLSWLERHDPVSYRRVLAGDAASLRRLGHGNAIAQGYNHAILPLCNERDRRTQIRWGVADFEHRFGRAPAALWLPETACNDATLVALAREGMQYAILSPHQAARVRPLTTGEAPPASWQSWQDVSDGSVDPRRAYLWREPGGSRTIALFFYDAHVARAIAFEGVLSSSQSLVNRLVDARGHGDAAALVHTATDGESYGHHTRHGERSLAHALAVEGPAANLEPINYATFLARHPPTMEVEIKPGPHGEGTAWSCAHGTGRWLRDCGCQTGGRPGWTQAWRGPLRAALDVLRDAGAALFEERGATLLRDPWATRDAYVDVILGRTPRDAFIASAARGDLSPDQRIDALTLLEMQRFSQLMYTSCGWFFTELSGIETLQVLRYAARVLDGFGELSAPSPRDAFLERLAEARSNIAEHGNGADLFMRQVEPARVSVRQVVASLAIESLVDDAEPTGETAGYRFERSSFKKERHGRITMATGRVRLEHIATGREEDWARVAIHFGGVDFYCAVRGYPGDDAFHGAAGRLWAQHRVASLPALLRAAREELGPDDLGLESTLPGARERVARMVYDEVLDHLAADHARVFRQHERVFAMLETSGLLIPAELRSVATFALGRRLDEAIRDAVDHKSEAACGVMLRVAREVRRLGLPIEGGSDAARRLEDLLLHVVEAAVIAPETHLERARRAVETAHELRLFSALALAQERAIEFGQTQGWPVALRPLAEGLLLNSVALEERAPEP